MRSQIVRMTPKFRSWWRDSIEWCMLWIDRLLLALPGMSYFAATAVLLARKPAEAQ